MPSGPDEPVEMPRVELVLFDEETLLMDRLRTLSNAQRERVLKAFHAVIDVAVGGALQRRRCRAFSVTRRRPAA